MSKLSDIINQLENVGSTLTKKNILSGESNNAILKKALYLTENPMLNFYIRLDKMPRKTTGAREITLELLEAVESNLNGRKLTGNAARDWVESRLDILTAADQIILTRIINRDLECKVGTSIINATWAKLIPTMPCMLADKLNTKTMKNLIEVGPTDEPKIIVQSKCDGFRAHFSVDESGIVTAYTRSGNVITLHGVFDEAFKPYINMVFDGELLVKSNDGVEDRATGNGFGNKAVRGTITQKEAERFSLVLWDIIPTNMFWDGTTYKTPYTDRLKQLTAYVNAIDDSRITVVDVKFCRTLNEVQEYYDAQVNAGNEGAIAKSADMPWENKRSKFMLKMKEELDATMICVGTLPHSKNPDWIGSLECESADGKVKCSIGSGFTEEDRKKDPSFYIGQLIDLVYNGLIKSKSKETYSLFLPIYRQIRTDVTTADDLSKFL